MNDYGPDEQTQWLEVGPVTLESSAVLPDVKVAYRTWGELAPGGDNAVLVCHALTGDANIDRWWSGVLGPGRGLDTDRWFVVGSNVIGGCYGTTGPASTNSEAGRPWGPLFPAVTIRDMVAVQHRLLDHLGVGVLAGVVGGSMGGMQALEWTISYPDQVRAAIPIAVGAVHSPWCIGIGEAQRQAIWADPDWLEGWYQPDAPPARGLAVARQIGMVSYRSPESFSNKFGRTTGRDGFAVESYLRHQGLALVGRFDANTYIALTLAMDGHDVGRERGGVAAALSEVTARTTVIGIRSDMLYPTEEQRELVQMIPGAEYREMDAPHGHDAFLIEFDQVGGIIAEALATP